MELIIMDRFSRLQKILAASSFSVAVFFGYMFAEKELPWYVAILSMVLSLMLYFILENNPFSKIIFNHNNKNIFYYEFFIYPRIIPVGSVLDISGQTKIEHSYGGGISKTNYITDIFIFTNNQDYQIKVFEKAKLNEFAAKFRNVQLSMIIQ